MRTTHPPEANCEYTTRDTAGLGKTRESALKNVEEAIRLCLEVRAEQGIPLTGETRQVEVALSCR